MAAKPEKRVLKDGTTVYRVVWWEDGKRQQKTFGDHDEAARFRQLVEGSGNRWPQGMAPPKAAPDVSSVLTFGDWAETAIGHRTRANERTKADYRRDLETHFASLVPLPLDGVSDAHVTAWLNQLRALDEDDTRLLAEKTIRNLHGFASSVYVDALTQHPPIVTHNPFVNRLGDAAQVHTEEMVFLTPQEFTTVHDLMLDEREYPRLARFLFATGARYGEATALKVGDVDLMGKRKTVTITKAWKRTGPSDYVIGEPKTPRSRRTLSLSDELVELLIPVVSARRGSELLFPGAAGDRLPHSEFYKRGWAPAVARANVCATHYEPQRDGRNRRPRLPAACDCAGVLGKVPRIHDLRHSHASVLISDGVQLPAISRRLGHSSITITMDRYGHLDPSVDEQINAAVDRALTRR